MSVLWPKCAVIGAGLIGASVAGGGRRAGVLGWVAAAGRSQANLDKALERQLVDSVTQSPIEAVEDADLVVLATPVDHAVDMLPSLVAAAPADAVFTDVGSVKVPIVEAARAAGIGERFVGAHPLAGSADSGAGAADTALFHNRVCVLTPSAASSRRAVAGVEELWTALGSRVLSMDAATHDRALALTSHLPHMLAYALSDAVAARDNEQHLVELIASGFRDTTRLAASSQEMWVAIAGLNRDALVEAIDFFASKLAEVRGAVAEEDSEKLEEIFARASHFRRSLD